MRMPSKEIGVKGFTYEAAGRSGGWWRVDKEAVERKEERKEAVVMQARYKFYSADLRMGQAVKGGEGDRCFGGGDFGYDPCHMAS